MNAKQVAAGFATAAALATGGTFVADSQINPYEDKGDRLEIVASSTIKDAGKNTVKLEKDRAAVTLEKWNGEAGITVAYEKVKGDGSRAFLTDRMEWKDGAEEVHAYPLEAGPGMEDGGFEIEVILNEKPDTNVFEFKIEGAEELDFFYQPALTIQEIAEGAERPDNVVGSYAVYHKQKADHLLGSTNYSTGKAYHIYRPKAFDAEGNETWAELSYGAGTLSVAVPEKWLAKASYPVRVDPTFGYTTIGATANNIAFRTSGVNQARRTGKEFFVTQSGTITNLHAAVRDDNALGSSLYIAFSKEDGTAVNSHPTLATAEETGVNFDASFGFRNLSSSGSFSAGWYILSAVADPANFINNGEDVSLASDTGTLSYSFFEQFTPAGEYAASKEDPWTVTGTAASNNLYSLYATYTACDPAVSTCVDLFHTPGSSPWVAPTGVNSANVACWGGGGGGDIIALSGGGGGGGGAFASSTVSVTPGSTYTITVGTGGVGSTSPSAGGDSTFATTTVVADGGTQAVNEANGVGGSLANSTGDVEYAGGDGGDGNTSGDGGGGGGGSAGPSGAGATGTGANGTVGGTGGTGTNGTGGTGGLSDSNGSTAPGGGPGGRSEKGGGGGGGGDDGDPGGDGSQVGGGGGGGEVLGGALEGGDAGAGQCKVVYTVSGGGGGGDRRIITQGN